MLLRETVLLSPRCTFYTHLLQGWHNHSHICMQWTRLENWPRLNHIVLFYFSCLDSFILGQVPSLLLYAQLHNAGCSPQTRRRNEWQVNPPAQQRWRFMAASGDRSSTGWGSTPGQFCQSNILQLNPYQHEISESDTQDRWILHEITVTSISLALIAEKQPSTRAFLTAEPLRLASLETGNRNLTLKVRKKLLPQKHYAIIFWIILLPIRVRKKKD